MNSFYSQQAGCTVRWQDLPGHGDPVVFIHGLGCASSYEYPRVVCDPLFGARRAILIDQNPYSPYGRAFDVVGKPIRAGGCDLGLSFRRVTARNIAGCQSGYRRIDCSAWRAAG